jgi:hypothetical protein
MFSVNYFIVARNDGQLRDAFESTNHDCNKFEPKAGASKVA